MPLALLSDELTIDLAVLLSLVPKRELHMCRKESSLDLVAQDVVLVPIRSNLDWNLTDRDSGQISSQRHQIPYFCMPSVNLMMEYNRIVRKSHLRKDDWVRPHFLLA